MSRKDAHFYRDVDNNENKPASEKQREYLYDLIAKVEARGKRSPLNDSDVDDLTVSDASDFIDELRGILY